MKKKEYTAKEAAIALLGKIKEKAHQHIGGHALVELQDEREQALRRADFGIESFKGGLYEVHRGQEASARAWTQE